MNVLVEDVAPANALLNHYLINQHSVAPIRPCQCFDTFVDDVDDDVVVECDID